MINAGQTANFVVWYDNSLTNSNPPNTGPALAQAVLDYCEYDLARLSLLFGGILPPQASLPITVNLVPGAGGAWNDGVNSITCNISAGSSVQGISALVVAEEAEIFMNVQADGWNPGWSNGEALSRVSAQVLYPNRAWLFSTGEAWLNSNLPPGPPLPRPDWVDQVKHTDQDFVSIGCGSLFLNYLAYQLNLRWPDIIGVGAPTTNTLAETATKLNVQNAYQNFYALLAAYFPPSTTMPVSLPPQTTDVNQPPEPTDDPFPLGAIPSPSPVLYIRHNTADNGTSHAPPLSSSPDIILKNNPVAQPQATFSTPASIGSATQSDPDVLASQTNYVYLRVWNRGADAANVFATVYWSPAATLVTPSMWNLIGDAYYPDVPPGSVVQISNPGIVWPADQIPAPGHYCFVATVGNANDPAPDPTSLISWNDFVNYIAKNNNIAWRNFNVIAMGGHMEKPLRGEFVELPFLISGAWDQAREFAFEIIAKLPEGSSLALQVAERLGRALQPNTRLEKFGDPVTDPKNPRRVRIPIPMNHAHPLGQIELPAAAALPSHLLLHIPPHPDDGPCEIAIRQLYAGMEVGRITWRLVPAH